MFFESKQKKIEGLLTDYRGHLSLCLERFHEAFQRYCTVSDRAILKKSCEDVHESESLADDVRHEIEILMYTKALFPESRGDMLGLIETMDRIPNQAQSAVRRVYLQHATIPADLCSTTLELVRTVRQCGDVAVEAAGKLFTDFTSATTFIGKIDELESEADRILSDLIEKVFSSGAEGFNKIMLRDIFESIEAVSDRAEEVSNRIRIIVAKRRV